MRGLCSFGGGKPKLESDSFSSFGMGVDQEHALEGLFPQEKAASRGYQKVFVCSETALITASIQTGTTRGVLLRRSKLQSGLWWRSRLPLLQLHVRYADFPPEPGCRHKVRAAYRVPAQTPGRCR